MHWILHDHFFSGGSWEALVATLDRLDLSYSVHAVTPMTGELRPKPALAHQNVVCFGSYSMRHVAAENSWAPGVFDFAANDFAQQRDRWGEHLLNFDSVVSALQEAVIRGERMFVRPTNDSKVFAGRIFTADEFADWRKSVCGRDASAGSSLRPETQIQLSVPKTIHAEYRFWVVKGIPVTQSLYRRGGLAALSNETDERLVDFVQARIQEWVPHETFVMDVCDTDDGIKIVETNTLNSSAFYAADILRLVMALENAYTM
jgi:hypothetical protein